MVISTQGTGAHSDGEVRRGALEMWKAERGRETEKEGGGIPAALHLGLAELCLPEGRRLLGLSSAPELLLLGHPGPELLLLPQPPLEGLHPGPELLSLCLCFLRAPPGPLLCPRGLAAPLGPQRRHLLPEPPRVLLGVSLRPLRLLRLRLETQQHRTAGRLRHSASPRGARMRDKERWNGTVTAKDNPA